VGYRFVADAVVVFHALFIVFVVLGVLLVVSRPWLAWLHAPAVVWVVLLELNGWACPLTPLEIALRQRAGDAGYAGGFVDHYLLGAIYPTGLTRDVQAALGAVVIVINMIAYAILWKRVKARRVQRGARA
jgi:cytochrome c biogenesis protein CcdA